MRMVHFSVRLVGGGMLCSEWEISVLPECACLLDSHVSYISMPATCITGLFRTEAQDACFCVLTISACSVSILQYGSITGMGVRY